MAAATLAFLAGGGLTGIDLPFLAPGVGCLIPRVAGGILADL